ncbi:MAG: class I SAM-dependent methyltransferase [Bacillota bacterium]
MDFQQTVIEKYRLPEEVDFYTRQAEAGLTAEEEKLLSAFLPPRADILDLGCGAGREAFPLARAGHRVTGADISPELIRAGEERAGKSGLQVRFRLIRPGDSLPFPDKSFQAVLMLSQLLGHIQGRANRLDYLKEARRTAGPGGLLFASVHDRSGCAWDEWRKLQIPTEQGGEEGDIWIDQISDQPTPGRMYFHLYGGAEIIRDLRDSGWEILHWWAADEAPPGEEPAVWDRFLYLAAQKPDPLFWKVAAQ